MLDLDTLLAPLPGPTPCGVEALELGNHGDIKEARREDEVISRRADDPPRKLADWPKVMELCSRALATQSKDLQLAAWLVEAATMRHGFPGLAQGLQLVSGLLERFWAELHPVAEDGDLAPRRARLEWLDGEVAKRIQELAITPGDGDSAMSLRKRRDAADMEELARRQPQEYEQQALLGRTTAQAYADAVAETPLEFAASLLAQIEQARAALQQLQAVLAQRFEARAPSLRQLQQALEEAQGVVQAMADAKAPAPAPQADPAPADADAAMDEAAPAPQGDPMPADGAAADAAMDAALPAPANASMPADGPAADAGQAAPPAADGPASRQQALRQLGEIAALFRRNEPHSPVPFLIEQAVRWADTPLDLWLGEVIRDDATLGRLREILGLRPPESG